MPTTRAVIAALAVSVALSACAGEPDPPGEAVTPTGTTTGDASPSEPSSAPPAATPTAVDPSPSRPTGVPTGTEVLADGLTLPWSAAAHPGGGWLVSQRDSGEVLRLGADGGTTPVTATGPGGAVPGVAAGGEGGLLGLAVLERDETDGSGPWLYAYLTTETSGQRSNTVVRMPFDPAGDVLGDPVPVVTGIPAAGNHNGGRLAFGPDGHLYATTGDAGDTSRSQDLGSLGGKVLRVTTTGAVPPDNPFPGSPVWTYGHRNVQGIGWDAAGRMFASEFGQDRLDELNLLTPGSNYGWPQVEGAGGVEGLVDPLATWSTDDASPSGLAVTGDAVYLAALRGERLWRVPLGADGSVGAPQEHLTGELGRLRDVSVTADGALLVLTSDGDGADVAVRVSLG